MNNIKNTIPESTINYLIKSSDNSPIEGMEISNHSDKRKNDVEQVASKALFELQLKERKIQQKRKWEDQNQASSSNEYKKIKTTYNDNAPSSDSRLSDGKQEIISNNNNSPSFCLNPLCL